MLLVSRRTRCPLQSLNARKSVFPSSLYLLSTPLIPQQTLKFYNANLADLTHALQNGTVVATFPSVSALLRYSRKEGKICGKADVKKDKVLKAMLRELFGGGRKGRK